MPARKPEGDHFTPEMCAWLALRFVGRDIDEKECNEWVDTWIEKIPADFTHADFRVTKDDLERQKGEIMSPDGPLPYTKAECQSAVAFKLIESPGGRKAIRCAMRDTTRENLIDLLGLNDTRGGDV